MQCNMFNLSDSSVDFVGNIREQPKHGNTNEVMCYQILTLNLSIRLGLARARCPVLSPQFIAPLRPTLSGKGARGGGKAGNFMLSQPLIRV